MHVDIPVLVDAAHAPGMLPVDVAAIGADFWVGNLHKWAFAPRGTALLAVAPGWRRRIEPLVVSWEQDAGFPLSVEFQGTLDYTPWLAAPAGLFTAAYARRRRGAGAQRGARRVRAAGGRCGARAGTEPDLPDRPADRRRCASCRCRPALATTQTEAHALRQQIADKLATEVAVNAWGGRGWLRLSAQVYNRAEDYDRLAERLPPLLSALRADRRPTASGRGGERAAHGESMPAAAAGPGRDRAGPADRDSRRPAAGPSAGRPPTGQPGWPGIKRARAPRRPRPPRRPRTPTATGS